MRQGGRVCESFFSDIWAGSPVGRVETLGGRGRDGPRRPRAQHDPTGAPRRLWTVRVESMAPGQPLRSRHDANACQGPALSQCMWPSPRSGGQHPLRPRRGGTSIKGSWPGGSGGRSPRGSDFSTFMRFFHARRRGGTPPASDASCVSAVERRVFHVGRRAACALVLHCSQHLGHTTCQAC